MLWYCTQVEKAYGSKDGMEGKEALPDPEEDTRQTEDDDDAKIAEDKETGALCVGGRGRG